jgi:hypothetical protein
VVGFLSGGEKDLRVPDIPSSFSIPIRATSELVLHMIFSPKSVRMSERQPGELAIAA